MTREMVDLEAFSSLLPSSIANIFFSISQQGVQGSPEALGPKWLTGNRHRPSGLVWRGDDTLCGGRGDPLPKWRSSLVEAASK
jgi:hypothetical protein